MKFNRYYNPDLFRADVLPLLLADEVVNNLQISIISDTSNKVSPDWLMGTVTDGSGGILLAVLCTKPFNMLLYPPGGSSGGAGASDPARFLAGELRRIGFFPPGVLAQSELARCFADAYTGKSAGSRKSKTMVLMKLDKLSPYKRANGICRVLTEADLSYVALWEQAFCVDCRTPQFPLDENERRIRTRLGKDIHYIWEDALPVSQAVFGRETPNGGVINWVYTPPLYRGRGYATSVVAELSQMLLSRGKSFCCLFADADNPVSRGIYGKLGYYDICSFDETGF